MLMKKIIFTLFLITLTGLSISCKTTKEISEDLTAAQIIQLGQDAFESSNYKEAERCYKTVLERFASETATYVEAKYELGHIYIKTKKYDLAKACFTEILEIYDKDTYASLPGSYKKLSQIGLSKIPE